MTIQTSVLYVCHSRKHIFAPANPITNVYTTCSNIFFVVGINYKKTNAAKRGDFAINNNQYSAIITKSSAFGVEEFFVLSTCNRTEIYGLATNAEALINLLCSETIGSKEAFKELCYIKKGIEAVEHIFAVGAGLDSQILGDYEIVGQLKTAIKFSKENGRIGAFTERLVNTVLQSSKSIKNQTQLSSGTVSVSFAAIQFIKNKVHNISQKKIALVGTGKVGTNTCKNLIDYLDTRNVTLINRTDETAIKLANQFQIKFASYDQLDEVANDADIVIVATNSASPILSKQNINANNSKILIDLSIPNNIHPELASLPSITLINVDDLSKINDETLLKRTNEIPLAKQIIATHISAFTEWVQSRRFAPAIAAVKDKLTSMSSCKLFHLAIVKNTVSSNEQKIQSIVKNTAIKMRSSDKAGCNYIEAINEYIIQAAQ